MNLLNTIKKCTEDKTNYKKIRKIFIDEYLKYKNDFINLLYVDVPFCRQKCGYCMYSGKSGFKKEEIQQYLKKDIKEQISNYKELFKKVEFDMVYFGGGTPNSIGAQAMRELYETIPNFRKIKYKMTELHPALITDEQLELLKEYKFDCVSCGIQSLNAEVLKKNNRIPFLADDVKKLTEKFEEMGIFYNYDLITYLNTGMLEDIEELKTELKYLCSDLQVKCITVHYVLNCEKTKEKLEKFVNAIKEACNKYRYECVNGSLSDLDVNIALKLPNTLFELKIVRKDALQEFVPTHVTFEFNLIGIPGMNVLSIGYSKKHHTWSFCGNLLYIDGSGKIEIKDDMQDIRYADLIYFNKILKEKNIKFPTKESLNMLKKQKENCR